MLHGVVGAAQIDGDKPRLGLDVAPVYPDSRAIVADVARPSADDGDNVPA